MEKTYSYLISKNLVRFLIFFFLLVGYLPAKAQCFYVQSILVDACNGPPCPGTATEGQNEMFSFVVGNTALNVSNLTITWPSPVATNPWRGIETNTTITTPLVNTLNSTIISCGWLKEPVGGVLPANATVLVITSTDMCTAGQSFASLTDTLYVIFQVAGNTNGHFANYSTPSGIRTLTVSFSTPPGCSESVSYDKVLLINQAGGHSAQDGAGVDYTPGGVATYINRGCQAPYIPIDVTASAPASTCSNASPTLTGVISGPATTYSWTSNGTGTISVPTGTLSGVGTTTTTVTPTYSPGAGESGTVTFTLTAHGKCSISVVTNTVAITINPAPSPTITSSNGASICNGGSTVLTASGAGTFTWNPGSHISSTYTVSPVSTQIYSVAATNTCGTTNATYTVTVNPSPTYTLASNSYTLCNGSSQTFTVSGASTYTWTPTSTLTNANTANPTATPTATTIYSVTGTSANGCTNATPATVTVTINPVPTLTLTASSATVCSSGSTTLTASGANTYTWSSSAGGGLSGTSGSSVTVTPTSSPATYTVVGTTSAGCQTSTKTTTVTIVATPTISITQATFTTCLNTPVTFTASGTSTYTWTPTIGMTGSNTANPTVTPSTTTTTIYSVTGTSSGCTSTANTVTLTINPLPTYSLTSNSYTICNGSSQTFTVSGASTYTWTNPATLTGANTANPTASPTTTTVYSVTGTSASACSNLTPATVTVTVNPKPTYTLSGNAYTICNGGSQTFSVSGASTYTWTPATTLTGTNTANPTASPTTTTVYSVTGTSALSCSNLTPATVTVNVTAIPSMSLAASSYTICNGGSQTFTVSGASTYTWTNPATLTGASTASPTANPTTTTVYTVSGTASGCASSSPLTVTLTVNPTPTISIAPLGSNSVICNGASVVITPSVNPSSAATYTLNPGNQVGPSFTVSPISSITYTINATDGTTGCPNAAAGAAIIPITVNPTPTITINPLGSNSVICNGASVVITPSVNPSSAATYTLNPGSQIGTSFTVSPSSSITGTDGTTTCQNATSDAASVPITVNPTPTISIAPLGSNSVICNGGSVVITPSGATTYTLNPGNQTGTSCTVSPTSSITYTINGSDGTTACQNATSDAASVPITVNPTPTISINPLGSNSVICNGGSVVITPSGATTYTLNPGNQTGTSFTVSPSSSTTYTIDGSNSVTGCSNAITDVVSVPITVNPTPTISIAPLGSNSVICSGTSVVITPSGATTYTLNPGNQVGTSFTVNPLSTTTYTVDGSDGSTSCTNAAANAALAPIMVNQTPTLSVSGATVASANCGQTTGGVSGIDNSSVSGGAAPYNYQWTSVSTGSVVSTTSTLINQGLGTYSLLVTDVNGCVANVTGGSSTFTVPASAAIVASMANSNPTTGTVPLAVSFTNTSVGATNYTWSFGDGDTSTAVNPTNTYTNAGTYTVILTAINGACSDTHTITVIANVPTTLIIPNVFSPNGDGTNDEFFIPNTGMASLNCDIFNRWGQLLYTITAPNQGWDGITPNGDKAPEGTYMYLSVAKGLDGQTYKQQGTVMLVR